MKKVAGLKISEKVTLDLKFCKTWYLVTPPLSHHWYYWDSWIERHDHHWIWLGTWIGRRNFKSFMWFIISLNLTYLVILLSQILLIINTSNFHQDIFKDILLYFVLIVSAFQWTVNSMYIVFLFLLIGYGYTSNQYLTQSYKKFRRNPFTLGWKLNFKRVFGCKKRISRIRNIIPNLEILQEYGEIIKKMDSIEKNEEREEWYKENNSEVIDHQDVHETIIDQWIPQTQHRSRQLQRLLVHKKKLNDTNFETIGGSRDCIASLDWSQQLNPNYYTYKDQMAKCHGKANKSSQY